MYILVGSVNQELNAMALHHGKYGGVVDDMALSHHVDIVHSSFTLSIRLLWLLPKIAVEVQLWLPSLTHVYLRLSFSWASHLHGNDFRLIFNTISTKIQSFSPLSCLAWKRGKEASDRASHWRRRKTKQNKNNVVNGKLKWWPNE